MPESARRDRLRDAGLRLLYRLGWRLGPRLPRPVTRLIMNRGSRYALGRGGPHVAHLRRNLTVASGGPADDDLVRAGLASYLRNFLEVLALPGWSEKSIVDRVVIENRAVLDAAVAGHGAVVALPHAGNWDLAGAWACRSGMPVTTVAEQLNGPEFAAFLRYRESLGLEVISHRDPDVVRRLCAAITAGRVVCLVADRDLLGTGVPVRWGSDGPMITMPAGPALVARRTGAALIPCVPRFVGSDVGAGMIMTLGDPVIHRPGRAGLTAMTAEVADFFAREIAKQPEDWHLMQAFFPVPAMITGVIGRTRVGLVCPYALDVPGGVQNHVLGLAGYLLRSGVDVHVLAPGTPDPARLRSAGVPPDRVTSAGPALPVPYNGSIARVNFGPRADRAVRRWLAEHDLDLLHLHEPITPSVSLLALSAARVPVVATFHTATPRSRTMQLAGTALRRLIAKIDAGIAVSATARKVVVQHLGRDAVIIPNGFDHAGFTDRRPAAPRFWTTDDRPRLSYLGRLDEPRKGLDVLLSALPRLEAELGTLDVAVAGQGQAALPAGCRRLGPIDDHDRVALLASSDVFVAPHRARESFGIVVIEAMTAGAVVVASGIPAFADLLGGPADDGRLGFTFPSGDPDALAGAVGAALAGDRAAIARRAADATRRFDWSVVGEAVGRVYGSVLARVPARSADPPTATVLDDVLRRRAWAALTVSGTAGTGAPAVARAARRALGATGPDRPAAESDLTLALSAAGLELGEVAAELVLARRLHHDAVGPHGPRFEMIDEVVDRPSALPAVVSLRN